MNIRHLRIMKAVSEEASMSRAAEKLYMSQPGISHAIAELEAEVGAPLFDRICRRIQLNEAGKLFLDKAVRLLELYDELEQGAPELARRAPVRLGSSITIANFQLPAIIRELERKCPATPFHVTVDNALVLQEKLLSNELDAALVEGPVHFEQLVGQPYSAYELAVLCAGNHPLACRETVLLEELLNERWLLREQGSSNRDIFDSALLLRGLTVEPAWVSVNSQALVRAVAEGLGLTVLPRILVRQELKSGQLAQVEVSDFALSGVCQLVTHKDKPPIGVVAGLRDIIMQKPEASSTDR